MTCVLNQGTRQTNGKSYSVPKFNQHQLYGLVAAPSPACPHIPLHFHVFSQTPDDPFPGDALEESGKRTGLFNFASHEAHFESVLIEFEAGYWWNFLEILYITLSQDITHHCSHIRLVSHLTKSN
jgi:hypothetical protein